MPAQDNLPIWKVSDAILRHTRERGRLVLVAPTGSGKTTQVPQMLLDSGIAGGKRVVVLQPRRVAARSLANRVAWERNCKLGGEVGYQVRFDDRMSNATRLCFITEGVLLRWLQDDPTLSDIGVLVFDEFHERNLLSDVSLALAKRIQQTTRPDLKLVVMSATLDAEPVADYLAHPQLGSCPIVISEGQMFGVQVSFLPTPDDRPAPQLAAEAVADLIHAGESGDILVFMPGMGEIQTTIAEIRAQRVGEPLALLPLHGELSPEDQDAAFAPQSVRKIVVSTNVAETSVTIDGIRHVVDSGLARVSRYDPERGIHSLLLEGISRASADQRKGRAGRTSPGTCRRLWTESNHLNRAERTTPEIQRADLAEVVLLLHSLGVPDAAKFDWLDKPDAQGVARAEQLLRVLGAIDPTSGKLTEIGRHMLRLPMHPRFSRMLLEARKHNCVKAAALCAALVSGRDLLFRLSRDEKHVSEAREVFEGSQQTDFHTLMRAWQFARNQSFNVGSCQRYGINAKVAREVEQTFKQILGIARNEGFVANDQNDDVPVGPADKKAPTDEGLLRSVVAGFADQLCQRKNIGTLDLLLPGNRTATLVRESVVQEATLFVAANLREISSRGGELMTLASLATVVKPEWLQEMFPQLIRNGVEHVYDRTHKRVDAIRLVRFIDITISREHQREVDPIEAGRALAEAFGQGAFDLPNLTHDVKQFIARVNFLAHAVPELEMPKLEGAARLQCLARAFHGLRLAKDAQAADLKQAFRQFLGKDQIEWLDSLAPLTVPWPTGKPLKLQYPAEALDEDDVIQSPEAQVKLLDCFDLTEHPSVADGQVPVALALCTPDGKRIDVTTDWPGFKATTYAKLRGTLAKKFPGFTWR